MKKIRFAVGQIGMIMLLTAYAAAEMLMLLGSIQIIEEDAFFEDTSIGEVILPEGIREMAENS